MSDIKGEFDNRLNEYAISEAKQFLCQLKASKILLENNDFACMIKISGLEFGLCNNAKLIPIIDDNIEQVEKFLKGEPNEFEE